MGSAIREAGAAASALGAYLTTVLPRVRRELHELGPLSPEKEMNAEAVAVFATLAPRSERATVVRASVALQAAIDLRDNLEEADGESESAVGIRIDRLDERWRQALATLPAENAVRAHLGRAVERCAQGQLHTHIAAREGAAPLRSWALTLEAPPDYRWWETAAGASSSVAAHALIAAAADPRTTAETGTLISEAYGLPVAALTVLLDDLVDRDADLAAGEHNYLRYYAGSDDAAERLALLAGRGEDLLAHLPACRRHRAILAGVAGFYLSATAADTPYAQPIRSRLLEVLGPGTNLLTAFMRLRRLGERRRPGQAGNSPGP